MYQKEPRLMEEYLHPIELEKLYRLLYKDAEIYYSKKETQFLLDERILLKKSQLKEVYSIRVIAELDWIFKELQNRGIL